LTVVIGAYYTPLAMTVKLKLTNFSVLVASAQTVKEGPIMKKTLRYRFKGNSISREEFRRDFKTSVVKFLGDHDVRFMFLVLEIATNIWDHAHGEGRAVFIRSGRILTFVIRDFGTDAYDLKTIKRGRTSKPESGKNFGLGLCEGLIQASAEGLNINLSINTTRGFCYKGVYSTPVGT
jgi:anti-sigma regulatory factor (Ser/Thr protein kinase)